MNVFGSLKLLMVLLGSSWPSWAALIPKWASKWVSTFCWSLFGELLEPILEPILRPDRPKRGQDDNQELQRTKNLHFQKPLKNTCFLKVFGYRGFSRKPQEAQDGSQKTPKKSKTPKNRNPKLRPKIIKKIGTNFWTHSKTQAQQKSSRKKKLSRTPFPRISGIQIMPRQKINERGEKAFLTEIILYKRKGGIRPYKAL